MEILFLLIGIVSGTAIAWLIARSKFANVKGASLAEAEGLKNQINNLKIEIGTLSGKNDLLEGGIKKSSEELQIERGKVLEFSSLSSVLKSENSNLIQKLDEQKREIEEIQQRFVKEFENLANRIFDEKSNKFTTQNRDNIDQILKPLNEKIKEFEKKVEETYDKESKQRFSLEVEIKKLYEANLQITKDATNLTNALKGQSKTQGNWGEFILESILEKSGLVKGREYIVQESYTGEDRKRFQPDIIINLPEHKSLVIDSKVSLVAYERYSSAEGETERVNALREHIASLKNHIKGLSGKNYQNLYQIQSLDFVLMFMPIESAFSLAVQYEPGLFNEAFEKNIVIVSPSTLLATLRTIASIWRQEKQNKNALEIARQSGALYDKFVGFIDDLKNVGNKIDIAKDSYDNAFKKLHEGSGNLISRVEKIKSLGAKTTKSLPQALLDRTENNDEDENLLN
ncbi:MAG: DNA recombination protein RmuC [Ignavibacteria bacterium]|nr:DNA recombination protein RmuC [Ignavibacteria bacterium]PIX94934.1 MAG: DNA recombination protein RmuC [Ignavibacteria bacterium CG_4_10_14_3_um_filter_37_18]PJC60629.1 MAG: DNA recombination protein RmuC [Ignavibacteria bacterium CG_4_9_14_0_2_um_filter_37_13]